MCLKVSVTLQGVSAPVEAIERLARALGGGAAAVIWAALLLACVSLFLALMRAKDRHLAREAETAASFQAQLRELTTAHAAKLDELHEEYAARLALERDKHMATAVGVIPVASGLLQLVDDLKVLAQDARERKRTKRKADVGSAPKPLPSSGDKSGG